MRYITAVSAALLLMGCGSNITETKMAYEYDDMCVLSYTEGVLNIYAPSKHSAMKQSIPGVSYRTAEIITMDLGLCGK